MLLAITPSLAEDERAKQAAIRKISQSPHSLSHGKAGTRWPRQRSAPQTGPASAGPWGAAGLPKQEPNTPYAISGYSFPYFLTFVRLEDQELISPERLSLSKNGLE